VDQKWIGEVRGDQSFTAVHCSYYFGSVPDYSKIGDFSTLGAFIGEIEEAKLYYGAGCLRESTV
jgi:hypothetical protein